MRVGVTGASGFIGSALVEALLERGDDVVRFVRPTSEVVRNGAVRWDPSKGDVDVDDLRRVGGLDAAVHLAGAGIGDHRWTESRKLEILTSRVQSTTLLVRTLAELPGGVAVLASGSAIGYYGSRGAETLDESASTSSPTSACAGSRRRRRRAIVARRCRSCERAS
jgi:NAD dependent epimerase/dehydratase family enzyme